MKWKDVVGYEDRYIVSEDGDIYSKITHQLLKKKIDRYGYATVGLSRNGKTKWFTIHRLVATAFIPNPDNLPTVNHKDENKLNNAVHNLEWSTVKDNDNHGTRNERMAKSKKKNPIAQYDKNMTLIRVHLGIKDAQRNTGVNRNSIREVCRGNRSDAGGYIWRYYKEAINE